ncbi:cyclase family protein [Frankia sp. CNm7]|uniref:Cyclase family protein n=1 Tax=Frankia nepalensis TaxID=1836974 RepID=A0A937REA1_9ACTN|nr:cyclase family protein [Frankia nepalensis]MBL7496646.1 cyclase family protein [Frankia nepalensis]MBL7511904.1 cyclase family protein [Frankia nepalensis]MBL7516655.1 cyclase family protein [Frankia nepalensis]MBL7627385.1 cyclase family protein [Frankia nepalensis]
MRLTAQDVRRYGKRLSNWGRWGDDDELGTLNHIGAEQIAAALALPRANRSVSLAIDFGADGPMPDQGRYNPKHVMVETGATMELPGGFRYADDTVEMSLQAATQWDSLAHVFYDGMLYNGRPSSLVTESGAAANAITAVRDGVVGRGVLLDVARQRGIPWLEPGTAIQPDELAACAAAQGVGVRRGDLVLVRTGAVGQQLAAGTWDPSFVFGPSAGLGFACAEWMSVNEIAAVAADNVAVEVMPGEVDDCLMPLHMVCQRDMGLIFGEIFNLERLSTACAASGRYEFLLVAPPLPFVGAVGSPVNPLAIL